MHPSCRSAQPILWTLLGTLLCFGVWLLMFPVDRPSGVVKFDPAPRRWLTELPNANALVQIDGTPSADALLVVGDSRASAAMVGRDSIRHAVSFGSDTITPSALANPL